MMYNLTPVIETMPRNACVAQEEDYNVVVEALEWPSKSSTSGCMFFYLVLVSLGDSMRPLYIPYIGR